jgi:Flp pilus assembly protein CpaB|tara:strand:- start:470 stop:607 length:138 start_codon:yes stop_codon:yes gene_type:complete
MDSLIFSINDAKQKVVVGQDKLDFGCVIQATKASYNPWDEGSAKN